MLRLSVLGGLEGRKGGKGSSERALVVDGERGDKLTLATPIRLPAWAALAAACEDMIGVWRCNRSAIDRWVIGLCSIC